MIVFHHKLAESWYEEDLHTMVGPLGGPGPWHDFFSRYNGVAVYKLGTNNLVADELCRVDPQVHAAGSSEVPSLCRNKSPNEFPIGFFDPPPPLLAG